MVSKGIIFLCENVHLHVANQTQQLIEPFGWKHLDFLLYSHDLAPSGYHVFLHLEPHQGGQRHDDNENIKTTVLQW